MKPINIQDIDKYPDKYNLTEDIIIKILGYMNGIQALAQRYYEKYFDSKDLEENKYLKLYQHTLTSLTGAKNAYATLGIMIEYNWPDHKNEWFLATREDAEKYINTDDLEEDEIIDQLNELIDYGDIQ